MLRGHRTYKWTDFSSFKLSTDYRLRVALTYVRLYDHYGQSLLQYLTYTDISLEKAAKIVGRKVNRNLTCRCL